MEAMSTLEAEPITEAHPDPTPRALGPYSLDTVHVQDCLAAMARMPDSSVDLVIADPPYNASKGGEWKWDNSVKLAGFGGNWTKISESWDSMGLGEYFNFTMAWLAEVQRLVRPTGSLWVHGTFHNAGIVNVAMQILGIEIINEVVWYKRNSFPNLSRRRLTASHETILWAHTGGKQRRYHFDYDAAKAHTLRGDNLKKPGKQLRTVWDIPNNKDSQELYFGKHPAQKPLRLLKRIIQISGSPGDTLLAPFAGSGSECVAAAEMGLRFLGFELDPAYVDIANSRIHDSHSNLSLFSSASCTEAEQS